MSRFVGSYLDLVSKPHVSAARARVLRNAMAWGMVMPQPSAVNGPNPADLLRAVGSPRNLSSTAPAETMLEEQRQP
jgi:hypothetical protein